MKKTLLVLGVALCIHSVNAMNFGIEPHDYSNFNVTTELTNLDKLLGIKEFDTTIKHYSLAAFVKNALKLKGEKPTIVSSSNKDLDVLCYRLKESILLTENGDYDFYFFIHELRNNWAHLRRLIGGVSDGNDQEKTKKPSLPSTQPMTGTPKTSGLGLSWLVPTFTYSAAFLGGVSALKLYQLYKAR